MALAVAERVRRMSPDEFLAFYEERPEGERWELYDGVPVQMMTPPFVAHQRIGSNLERLLNDSLETFDPTRIALFAPGFELPEAKDYRPEPDVIVMDAEFPLDQRYVTRAYLVAEVVSSTDRRRVPRLRRSRIDLKREIYRAHPSCEALLIIEQDRVALLVETRTSEGWTSRTLDDPDAELALPTFGLRCRVGDLYRNTPLGPRRSQETGR